MQSSQINCNNSVQFFIIYVASQHLQGQLQTQYNVVVVVVVVVIILYEDEEMLIILMTVL
jgi:hypothetical protein